MTKPIHHQINVLFVCSKNQWRSPTAEAIYRDDPRLAVRSRGTASSARKTVRAADLQWADLVLVMEDKHARRLRTDYPDEIQSVPIYVLDIPDDYQFMDPELVEMVRSATDSIIDRMLP